MGKREALIATTGNGNPRYILFEFTVIENIRFAVDIIGVGHGGRGASPLQKSGKIFFRQKSCKIRAFC